MPVLRGINQLRRRLYLEWRYLRRPPWDTGISPPELIDFIASHPPGRALDIGCGSGTNMLTLARAGWEVHGVDLSCLAIWRAKRKLRAHGVSANLYLGDVLNLPLPEASFDLILDIGCYHQLGSFERHRYREQVRTWLAAEGYFLWYAHLRQTVGRRKTHGIDDEDINAWESVLHLIWRKDTWEGNQRPAVWFLFQKRSRDT